MRYFRFSWFVFSLSVIAIFLSSLRAGAEATSESAEEVIEVAPVWSGHPVGFYLLTQPPHQYIAFYDADRRLTIASRVLDATRWTFSRIPETLGWDSHNSIVLAIDRTGYLHLAGNMHAESLNYYRTEKPFDAATFVQIPEMVGQEEDHVTYPEFFRGPGGELVFTYRSGRSGAGNQIYNVYDPESRTWSRLLDQPLVDGEGKRNAYFCGPKLGPDGYYHLCWVWRDTPDCASNHDLCYARSLDLRHWETSRGKPLDLPITFETCEIVDPVAPGGGIINGNTKIGFDAKNRPILSYHKFDAKGFTQVYDARLEEGGWKIRRITDWDYRWDFRVGGAIHFEIRLQPVRTGKDGLLTQGWSHDRYGSETWVLDPKDLKPLRRVPSTGPSIPKSLRNIKSDFPGMAVRFCSDAGDSGKPGHRYLLRWETLGAHRDRPREKPWPRPSMLFLCRIPE